MTDYKENVIDKKTYWLRSDGYWGVFIGRQRDYKIKKSSDGRQVIRGEHLWQERNFLLAFKNKRHQSKTC